MGKILEVTSSSFLLILASAFFLGCGSKSSPGSDQQRVLKIDSVRGCVSEGSLLAAGIIGGTTVSPNDSDSKLAVMLITGDGQLCTAAPIRKNVLLTAAHCLKSNPQKVAIVFHPSISCESGYDKRIHTRPVASYVVHEDYNSNIDIDQTTGDLALVFIGSDIPDGYPTYDLANPDNLANSEMLLYGYGRINTSSSAGTGILRRAQLPASGYEVNFDRKKVLVNQSGGYGICNGDSGGPALVTSATGELQILGVNSFVYSDDQDDMCGQTAGQTLAYVYREWIEAKIAEKNMSTVQVKP